MCRQHLSSVLMTLCVMVGAPQAATANTPEDVYGVGARNNGMGGAATSSVRDFTAVYYNPGALARCRGNQLSVSAQHIAYGALDIDIPDGSQPRVPDPDAPGEQIIDPQYAVEEPTDQTRMTVGLCNHLPFDLALGVLVAFNLQSPLLLDLATVEAAPQWGVFTEPALQIAINLGLGWAPNEFISIGAGLSVLIRSSLLVSATLLGGAMPDDSSASLRYNLSPAIAGYVGVLITPNDRVSIGLTYRSKLAHTVNLPVTAVVDVGIRLAVEILIQGENWHSPHQLALGASADVTSRLTLAADLTWYRWSGYAGPFLSAETEVNPLNVSFPDLEDVGFHDVVVPRVGAEWRPTPRSALRWGYSFRPSAVSLPGSSRGCRTRAEAGDPCITNVLDSSTHSVSLGGGYRVGALEAPEESSAESSRVFADIDAFVRYTRVSPRHVERREPEAELPFLRSYSFGGSIVEAGVTLALGWY